MGTIVVDLERLKTIHCGLGQYSLHLGRSLLAESESSLQFTFLLRSSERRYFVDRPAGYLETVSWPWVRPIRSMRGRFSRAARPFDLWHMTHQDSRFFPEDRTTPMVLTIHDLNVLRAKAPKVARRRMSRIQTRVNRSVAITTASEHAAGEIREHLDIGDRPIHVIPHGICMDSEEISKEWPSFLPKGPFLFTIGDITRKKNFHTLLDLMKRLPEYRLVIAGRNQTEYADQLRGQIAESQLQSRVILPGPVSDARRRWLYEQCVAFLFPSLSEGFGLPVIEALSCGRPVFSSSATSLPEVGGPLSFYWHQFDADSMERVFRQGMETVEADGEYSCKAREYARRFSWRKAVQQYLAVYRDVLEREFPREIARGARKAPCAQSVSVPLGSN